MIPNLRWWEYALIAAGALAGVKGLALIVDYLTRKRIRDRISEAVE